jgi:hypothetical protein
MVAVSEKSVYNKSPEGKVSNPISSGFLQVLSKNNNATPTAKNDFLPKIAGEEMLAERKYFWKIDFILVNAREKSRGVW